MKSLVKEIKCISQKLRRYLQDKPSFPLPSIPFKDFPRGCCSDSSFILRELLNKRLAVDAKLVSYDKSINGIPDSHAWVEVDELCIDITMDQFNTELAPSYPPVYVDSAQCFHKKYRLGEAQTLTPPDWLDYVVEHLDKEIFK
ncbi:hypothetical protein ACLEEZ_05630 [Lonsdalea quercina]|uniref:hypothetical protein n=1 Tax=Lonsdalea quercina TaxID=71657 RepID=UPI0039754B9C